MFTVNLTNSSQDRIIATFDLGWDIISKASQKASALYLHASEYFFAKSSPHVVFESQVEEDASAKITWVTD